jgi:hypothetical protein
MTLFFFKSNTFGHVYSHDAAKSHCRAMHGSAARVLPWQSAAALTADVAEPNMPRIMAWGCRATHHSTAALVQACGPASLPFLSLSLT